MRVKTSIPGTRREEKWMLPTAIAIGYRRFGPDECLQDTGSAVQVSCCLRRVCGATIKHELMPSIVASETTIAIRWRPQDTWLLPSYFPKDIDCSIGWIVILHNLLPAMTPRNILPGHLQRTLSISTVIHLRQRLLEASSLLLETHLPLL